MEPIQLKIAKDSSIIKYVKIIREFDSSLSMGDIKSRIESGDFVVEFDLESFDVLEDLSGVDRPRLFRGMIESLGSTGAQVSIYQGGEPISLEFLDNLLDSYDEIGSQVEADRD